MQIDIFMTERAIFDSLERHLSSPQATVITGMRRVGKTTAIRFLLNKIEHANKIFIDFEKIENRVLFSETSYNDVEAGLKLLGIDLLKPAIIALDEIQLVPHSPSIIKYLYDTYKVKFLLTGSSSYYLKNHFTESLAGRKRIFEMYPLSFKEYLIFKGYKAEQFDLFSQKPFASSYYKLFNQEYDAFLRYGSFPEVVKAETNEDKVAYIKDIIDAYIELDIKLLADFKLSNDLYKLCQILAAHTGSRIDYSKLSSISGISRSKITDYIELFEYTYFIHKIPTFTKNKDKEIASQSKLYIADNGILHQLAQVSSGQVFENSIALQLKQIGELAYYQKKSGQEIDFILNKKIAIEVKETASFSDLKVLNYRADDLNLEGRYLIGRNYINTEFKDWYWGGVF